MRLRSTYTASSSDGFTISELMVAITLVAIILAASYLAIGSVSAMADHVFAQEQANRSAAIAMTRIATDVREGWEPMDNVSQAFRKRWPNTAEFYVDPGNSSDQRFLVKYYTSADATGGTYSLYRAQAVTNTAVDDSDITTNTTFVYGPAVLISKGLTSGSIFAYKMQAAGLPDVTPTGTATSVLVNVVAKATVGAASAVATSTSLVQMRALYDYTTP